MMKNHSKKKILIVEDEVPLLSSLREKLSGEGFNVFTAKDGEEGLEIAKKEKPDLILIDILLPKKDGITMAKEINRLRLGTLMIFLTNLSDSKHISEAIEVETETVDYLVKSDWNINDVVLRVKQRLLNSSL